MARSAKAAISSRLRLFPSFGPPCPTRPTPSPNGGGSFCACLRGLFRRNASTTTGSTRPFPLSAAKPSAPSPRLYWLDNFRKPPSMMRQASQSSPGPIRSVWRDQLRGGNARPSSFATITQPRTSKPSTVPYCPSASQSPTDHIPAVYTSRPVALAPPLRTRQGIRRTHPTPWETLPLPATPGSSSPPAVKCSTRGVRGSSPPPSPAQEPGAELGSNGQRAEGSPCQSLVGSPEAVYAV